jgi:hypothetical protein
MTGSDDETPDCGGESSDSVQEILGAIHSRLEDLLGIFAV